MFRSGYSVSLCCSVYCLCVNVYCTAATGCQPNCSCQIFRIKTVTAHALYESCYSRNSFLWVCCCRCLLHLVTNDVKFNIFKTFIQLTCFLVVTSLSLSLNLSLTVTSLLLCLFQFLYSILVRKWPEILTFIGPCIVIYFYIKTNQMHNISNLFYFGTKLHVSDGLSVHHQESMTIHTASGICHTCSVAVNQFHLVPPSNQPQNLYDIYLMLYVQS